MSVLSDEAPNWRNLDAIRKRHQRAPTYVPDLDCCLACAVEWPCEVGVILDDRAALVAEAKGWEAAAVQHAGDVIDWEGKHYRLNEQLTSVMADRAALAAEVANLTRLLDAAASGMVAAHADKWLVRHWRDALAAERRANAERAERAEYERDYLIAALDAIESYDPTDDYLARRKADPSAEFIDYRTWAVNRAAAALAWEGAAKVESEAT